MSDQKPRRHVLQSAAFDDPDVVDRLFDLVLELLPEIGQRGPERVAQVKGALRREFAGEVVYIPQRSASERAEVRARVLALFNGRNATTVARELGISRASVYRHLKQAGRPSQFSGK